MPQGCRMGNWNSGRRKGDGRHPTAMRMLRGNPGKRPFPRHEPIPEPAPADFDTPPPELEGNAVAMGEWARVVPLLRGCGVISRAERSALIALCLQWAQWLAAQRYLVEHGMGTTSTHR